MISDQQKRKAKETVTTEVKRYIAMTVYLWVLFAMFEIHRFAVLRDVKHASISSYRIGFAALNAFIMAMVILIADATHVGERLSKKRLIHSVLLQSALLALIAICCNVVEGVIVGLIRGTAIGTSMPQMGGGGLLGIVLYAVIAFVVLIPFFLFTELQRSLGKGTLQSLVLQRRSKVDAA